MTGDPAGPLHHRRRGAGPVLVLQHGFLGSGACFEPQIEAFAGSHDVIAADLPGFAGSAGRGYPGSVEGLAAALVALLDSLGVERFALLGHSLGGLVAQQVALDHGARVERLVLYGTSSRGAMPNRHESFEQSIARLEAEGVAATAERIAKTWFVEGEAAAFYPAALAIARETPKETLIACLRSLPDWDVTEQLPALRMPTLVIHGERDRSYSRAEALALVEAIEGAAFWSAPGCAHNAHLEQPAPFNRALGRFLSGDAPPPESSGSSPA